MWGGPKSKSKYSCVYVLRDLNHRNRFKIGMSDDPDQRAKQEDWRLYGRRGGLPASIEVTTSVWNFVTPHAAYYIEQSIIQLLRSQGYEEIEENNWFEIDHEDLHFFLDGSNPSSQKLRKMRAMCFFSPTPAGRTNHTESSSGLGSSP